VTSVTATCCAYGAAGEATQKFCSPLIGAFAFNGEMHQLVHVVRWEPTQSINI
jgi:hypothetical protein